MAEANQARSDGNTEDPLRLKDCLYKYISVVAVDGQTYEGWLKTIDPVTGSIVLINFDSDVPSSVDVVMGHAYKNAQILKDSDCEMKPKIKGLFCVGEVSYSTAELSKRKESVKSWLLKNRLPVVEAKDDPSVLVVANVLRIEPPYGFEQCISANTIILGKIQNLLQNVPDS